MAVEFATYKMYVDWNHDGLYTHANAEIYSYVDQGEVSFKRGRDRQSQLFGRSTPGEFSVDLNNSSRIFSKFYSSSPIYGLIKPGRRIKFTMQIGVGTETTIFAGRLKNIESDLASQRSEYTAKLTAIGVLGMFTKSDKANLAMQVAISSGEAFGKVLESVAWLDSESDIDDGKSTLVRYWTGGEINILQALRDIEETEAGFIRETANGKIAFEDRSHRFLSPHTVSQATYTNSPTGALRYAEIHPIDTLDDIANIVEAQVRTFNLSEEKELIRLIDIYSTEGNVGDPLVIAAGETITIELKFPTKNSSSNEISISSWTNITYEANDQFDGTGADVTADVDPVDAEGVVISEANGNVDYGKFDNKRILNFKNNSEAAAYLVVLKADGIAVVEGDGFQVSNDKTVTAIVNSISDYGPCTYPFPGRFITSREEAQAFCDYFSDLYKDVRNAIILTILGNYSTAALTEIQTRDISDRITVVSDEGLSGDYFVESVQHKIWKNGIHQMTLICSAVPTATEWPASAVVYIPSVVVPPSNKVPDQLIWTNALPLASSILFLCGAEKWNATISQAEFRAKRITPGTTELSVDLRTAEEGGTFAHNGNDCIIVEDIFANWKGFRYEHFYGTYSGVWYWAVRLKNDDGWSNWTDGNETPQYVVDRINTEGTALYDVGPAADWDLTIRAGVQSGTAVVVATRPETNGSRIMSVGFQIRDTTAGAWRNLDSDDGAADTLYDGSEINHSFDPTTGILRKESGDYGAAVAVGGLLLIDVRQNSFDHRCVIWREVTPDQFNGEEISGLEAFSAAFSINDNGEYNKLRVKIVRPPWTWDSTHPAANDDGFQGSAGYSKQSFVSAAQIGDLSSDTFISAPFTIPTGLTLADLGARVWFENTYSVSDDENTTVSIINVAQGVTQRLVLHVTAAGEGGGQPAAGPVAMIRIPANLYIEGVTVLADAVGSIEFDLRVCTYANYPPDSGDSIVASAPPVLAAEQASENLALIGWNRNLTKDHCLVVYVQAGAATLVRATLSIVCSQTLVIGSGSTPGSSQLPEPWAYWAMDEIATFNIVGAPSVWWNGAGSIGRERYIWVKHTYQIAGDVESTANGDAYGPVYIPPLKALSGHWKSASRTIGIGTWVGGGAGMMFYDDSYALPNVKVIGYKIYTNSVDGGPVGIKGWQAIYRNAAGTTVYGPVRGTTSGETENQFLLQEDEYITGIKGYHGWSDQSGFKQKIIQLEFITNLGSYKYGSAYDTAFTINVPAGTANKSYTFAGLYGSYAGDPRAIRRVGVLYFIDTFDATDPVPDDVTGWNLYTSEDGETFLKANLSALDLTEVFLES